MLAFVSARFVDGKSADEPAGDHDPSTDDRFAPGWNLRVERLSDSPAGEGFVDGGYFHGQVPHKILDHQPMDRPRASALLPACGCTRIPHRVVS